MIDETAQVFGITPWITTTPPHEYTEAETKAVVAAIAARCDRMRRELRTNTILDYCRHMDSPAWRRKVEEIYERHPEWRHPDANWWD